MQSTNPYEPEFLGEKSALTQAELGEAVELDFPGLLGRIFVVYSRNILTLMICAIVYILFLYCIYILVGFYVYDKASGFIPVLDNLQNADSGFIKSLLKSILSESYTIVAVFLAAGIAVFIAQIVFQMVTVLQAGQWELGARWNGDKYARQLMLGFPVFIVLAALYWIMIILGMMFCVAPGLMFLVYYMMLLPQILIGRKSFNSLPESFYILKNRFWKTAGIFALLYILQLVVSAVLTFPLTFMSDQLMQDFLVNIKKPDSQIAEMFLAMMANPVLYLPYIVSTIVNALWLSLGAVASAVLYVNYSAADKGSMGQGFQSRPGLPDIAKDSPYN